MCDTILIYVQGPIYLTPEEAKKADTANEDEKRKMKQLTRGLCKEFADVISDEISTTPMRGGPAEIHFRDDIPIKPTRVSRARQIPANQEKQAKKIKYLEANLLKKLNFAMACADYC